MSKTAQRKRAMYDEGYTHGRTNHHFYWKRHPFIDAYRRGYNTGFADRLRAQDEVRDTSQPFRIPALFAGMCLAGAILISAVIGAA